MKLELQEKLYKETENLNLKEFVKYVQNDLKKSNLMEFFNKEKKIETL